MNMANIANIPVLPAIINVTVNKLGTNVPRKGDHWWTPNGGHAIVSRVYSPRSVLDHYHIYVLCFEGNQQKEKDVLKWLNGFDETQISVLTYAGQNRDVATDLAFRWGVNSERFPLCELNIFPASEWVPASIVVFFVTGGQYMTIRRTQRLDQALNANMSLFSL